MEKPTEVISLPAPCILGPFSFIIRYCGFDMSNSVFNLKELGGSRRVSAVLSTVISVIGLLLLFMKLLTLMFIDPEKLSLAWAESNIAAFMSLHAFVSALNLCGWTRDRLAGGVRVALATHTPDFRHLAFDRFYYKALVLGGGYVMLQLLHSGRDVMLNGAGVNGTEGWSLSVSNMFGLEPVLCAWQAVASSLAAVYVVVVQSCAIRQLRAFNDRLCADAKAGRLADSSVLAAYVEEHLHILSLARMVNKRTEKWVSFGAMAAVLSHINCVFILMGLKAELTGAFAMPLLIGWMVATGVFMACALSQAGQIAQQIGETEDIVLFDKRAWMGDERAMLCAEAMAARCRAPNNHQILANATRIDQTTPHKVFLTVPLVATSLCIMRLFVR